MSKQTVLVTGGAGYIGSHTVRMMAETDFNVVILDNLIYGHKDAIVSEGVELVVGDLSDGELLETLFAKHEFDAVIHFAAFAYVGESVHDPGKYYGNNTANPLVLLNVMKKHDCKAFVFSSTCATYGVPEYMPLDESHRQDPINPYGQSKLMLEKILMDYDRAHGIKSVRLRYFNACGCSEDGVIGEDHNPETHLIPRILMTLTGELDEITVFGTDYPTADGTCVRDYIHVLDLAIAHIKALQYLNAGNVSFSCNLGTGRGVSVKEIIDKTETITGKTIPVTYGERREGDPPELVANPKLAKEVLGWEAQYKDVADAIRSSWQWMSGERKGRYHD